MTKQISVQVQEVIKSAAFGGVKRNFDNDDVYGSVDTVAYEQVGLGEYWGTEEAPKQPVAFVGFAKN